MVNFDNVLRRIGEFGKAQILFYFLLGLCGVPIGQQNLESVFISASQDHWCSVPDLENLTVALRKNLSIPWTPDGGFEKCERFDLDFGNTSDVWDDSQLQVGNFTGPRIPCSSWEFDRSEIYSTVGSQFGLVCQHSYATKLITSLYMAGLIAGCSLCGITADKIGRLKTLVASAAGQTVFSLLAALVPSLVVHAACRFVVAACTAGTFTSAFVISMEIIGPKYRMQSGLFMQGFFALGISLVAVLAYFIRSHVTLQVVVGVQPLVFIAYYWILPESPRWLMSQGRYEEATQICKRIARINGQEMPENFSITEEPFEMDLPKEKSEVKEVQQQPAKAQGNVLDLMRTPNMRKRTLNVFFNWLVNSLAYYGLSLNAEGLGGSLYLNTVLSGLVELPAYVVCCFTLNRFGRVRNIVVFMIIGGVGCIVSAFIELLWLRIALAMIGKFAISASFAIIYIYSAEVFPTVIRNAGVGLASMCARIGGLLAPQIVLLSPIWPPLPSVLLGAMSLAAGLLALLLPETLNQPLPETIEDGEEFGQKMTTDVEE